MGSFGSYWLVLGIFWFLLLLQVQSVAPGFGVTVDTLCVNDDDDDDDDDDDTCR